MAMVEVEGVLVEAEAEDLVGREEGDLEVEEVAVDLVVGEALEEGLGAAVVEDLVGTRNLVKMAQEGLVVVMGGLERVLVLVEDLEVQVTMVEGVGDLEVGLVQEVLEEVLVEALEGLLHLGLMRVPKSRNK